MVFKPWTETPLYLGTINIVTPELALPPHLFLRFVCIFPLPPTLYLLPIRNRSLLKYCPFCTHSPPPLPAQSVTQLDVAHTGHPPACSACLCVLRRIPASSAVLCECAPPLATLGLIPGTCNILGGLPVAGPSAPLLSCLALLEFTPNPGIFLSVLY